MSTNLNSGKPRLLIIGARGFVGSAVTSIAASSHHLLRAERVRTSPETDLVLDLANPHQIASALRDQRPDQVLLLAAISDIDRCESDPAQAIAINLHGPESVANSCAQIGARLLFTSSGAVFDGKKIGYDESDPVSPLSVYGKTKADAEQAVLALLPSAIVLRLSLVLGRAAHAGTNSLLDSLIRRWSAAITVSAATHEYRNPIDLLTLSSWILELFANPAAAGIFHAGASEVASRYEIARALAKQLGISPALVQPEDKPPLARAPRGAHQFLFSTRISQLCQTPIPDFRQVIERSFHEFS